jgi:hypothetical protein
VGFEEGDEGGADFVHWPGGVGCEFGFGGAHGCCFALLCCWFGLYGIVLVLGLQEWFRSLSFSFLQEDDALKSCSIHVEALGF